MRKAFYHPNIVKDRKAIDLPILSPKMVGNLRNTKFLSLEISSFSHSMIDIIWLLKYHACVENMYSILLESVYQESDKIDNITLIVIEGNHLAIL